MPSFPRLTDIVPRKNSAVPPLTPEGSAAEPDTHPNNAPSMVQHATTGFGRIALMPSILMGLGLLLFHWMGYLSLGLGLVIAILVWRLAAHHRELRLFSLWLSHPTSKNVPSGHGVWTDIFAKLYALRRMDERHEAELAEWLARFQNTMRHLPDGVAILDKHAQLEWMNPVAERHFHLDSRRDLGASLLNIVREPAMVEFIRQMQFDSPMKLRHHEQHLEVTLIAFEKQRVILVSRDISEVERVDIMRRDFIANASHELRTPLTVISGFLEHAAESPDLPKAQRLQQISLMRNQAERMTALIADMLMLSRLESDVAIECQSIDMAQLLAHNLQSAQALSAGRHHFYSHIEADDLMGSETEINSVVSNLLSNAVRYTPDGGEIHLTWTRSTAGAPVLTVRDTGLGIAAVHLPRLTERFYRVNTDQSRATKGTGLGLAIVKHVLLRHGAKLEIHSIEAPETGHGTTFEITFAVS